MEIKEYKPRYHKNPDKCTEDCELDCNMECMICGKTPWETKTFFIIDGKNSNIQLCTYCFEELKKEVIKDGKREGERMAKRNKR